MTAPVTIIPPPKRDVTFRLTPYAKGLETASVGEPTLTLTLGSRRPGQAMDVLLKRLALSPGDVEVTPTHDGSAAVHQVNDPTHVYAFAWAGLSYVEAAQALARLRGDIAP